LFISASVCYNAFTCYSVTEWMKSLIRNSLVDSETVPSQKMNRDFDID
jgi:hypothetical protein